MSRHPSSGTSLLTSLVCLVAAQAVSLTASAKIVTFSEQPGGEGPLNPNPYTAAHGLPPGVTMTFSNFTRLNVNPDHTPLNSDNKLVYGTNGDPSTITFNVPVQVPSFWVSNGDFGSAD